MTRHRQRGDVPVGCLVGLVVLGIALMVGIKATPVMVNVGDLDRTIASLADRAGRPDYKDDRIIKDILREAEKDDLPVTKESITIERSPRRFKIWVRYQKDIDFIVYTYHWNKVHFQDRPIF